MDTGGFITVALVNDYEVVVRGLREMLKGDQRLRVVELEPGRLPVRPVDIALFDTFGGLSEAARVARLSALPNVRRVVVYSWGDDARQIRALLDAGADAYVSKTLGAEALVAALHEVHAGQRVVAADAAEGGAVASDRAVVPGRDDWPGRQAGLTYREAEVMALIGEALTNEEIAGRLHLSINTVKSTIRSAYRRLGLQRRSQAVRWTHANGLGRAGQRHDAPH